MKTAFHIWRLDWLAGVLMILTAFALPGQEVEPEEPELVLPAITLQIEDPSSLDFGELLPEGSGVSIRDSTLPVPEVEDILDIEPVLEVPFQEIQAYDSRPFLAEFDLRLGTLAHLSSGMAVSKSGDQPHYRVEFQHRMLDGFSNHDPGSGFYSREDRLSGQIESESGPASLDLMASFKDEEWGLQGNGIYDASIQRVIEGRGELEWGESHSISAVIDSRWFSHLLSGAASLQRDELFVSPQLEAVAAGESFQAAVNIGYDYLLPWEGADFSRQRFRAETSFAWDLPWAVSLAGSGGYLWSDGSHYPFDVSLSGSPWSFLSFFAGGGYRVRLQDRYNLLAGNPSATLSFLPSDDSGWSALLLLRGHLTADIALSMRTDFNTHTALVYRLQNLDPVSGLLPLAQETARAVTAAADLRWRIGERTSVTASWERALWWEGLSWEQPGNKPADRITFGGELEDSQGNWGGSFDIEALRYTTGGFDLPYIDLRGFVRQGEAVAITAEVLDLLAILAAGPRQSRVPIVEPGFRASIGVEIRI
jgi:hypothetical protein